MVNLSQVTIELDTVPAISIITPSYNAAAYIGRTIASVQAQTFDDWEHIIIDDGSTDDTCEVVNRLQDERVRYIYQANHGPAEARNHGIRASHGEYLIFLDAGDWWDTHCLEVLLARLRKEGPGAIITHGDWAFTDSRGNVGRVRSSAFSHGEGLNTLLFYNPFSIHAVLVPRPCIVDVGGFAPTGKLEDWDLWIRLAHAGCHFIHTPQLVACYHWQPNSRSKNIEQRKAERLTTLDHFWSMINPSDPIQSIRGQSYGTAFVDLCVSRFGQGDEVLALEEFDAAVERYRPIIKSVNTYYRIAYAEQAAYEGTDDNLRECLNEQDAQRRLELVLDHVTRQSNRYSLAEARAARCAAYTALGLAGYHERRHDVARRHLLSAVRTDPLMLINPDVGPTLAKTLLPTFVLDFIRQKRLVSIRT